MTDVELIQHAQKGDQSALAELIERHSGCVRGAIRQFRFNSQADRDDVFQNTMVQVLRRIKTFEGASSFGTWIYRIATNEALMFLRSRRRLRWESLDEAGLIATVSAPDDTAVLLMRAMGSLSMEYCELIVDHYFVEESLDEIGQKRGASNLSIRSKLHRARTALRAVLS